MQVIASSREPLYAITPLDEAREYAGGVRVRVVSAGWFRPDAGGFFGVVPMPLWRRFAETDERGRVLCRLNLLLIDAGGKRILVETGDEGAYASQGRHSPAGRPSAWRKSSTARRARRRRARGAGCQAAVTRTAAGRVGTTGAWASTEKAAAGLVPAEPGQEAEGDPHPDRRRGRAPDRRDRHDHGDQPVHALAAEHVGDPAEHERAEERRAEHGRVEHGELACSQVPVQLDQRGSDADHEQVVGIGEEAHAGHDGRSQVELTECRTVERADQILVPHLRQRVLLVPDSRSGRLHVRLYPALANVREPGELLPTAI